MLHATGSSANSAHLQVLEQCLEGQAQERPTCSRLLSPLHTAGDKLAGTLCDVDPVLRTCTCAPLCGYSCTGGAACSCLTGIDKMAGRSSGHTFIRFENASQEVEDLAAGKTLGEGLDRMPPVQKYHSITSLRAIYSRFHIVHSLTACHITLRSKNCAAQASSGTGEERPHSIQNMQGLCRLTSKKFSADSAPRVPPEKLSMNRTQWRSKGTVVPPDVTHTTGRVRLPAINLLSEDPSAALWLDDGM